MSNILPFALLPDGYTSQENLGWNLEHCSVMSEVKDLSVMIDSKPANNPFALMIHEHMSPR